MTEKELEEKKFNKSSKGLFGYLFPTDPLSISVLGVFTALTCVVTMLIAFPVPATQGFINIGDAIVMITGLLFGPIIGAIAGGVGSALADVFLGYTLYAPATLVIKGAEGFIVGLISNPRKHHEKLNYRDILGVLLGGLVMVIGYFLYEVLIFGVPMATYELILNGLMQFGLGGLIAIIFTLSSRRNLIENLPQVFEKIFMFDEIEGIKEESGPRS